MARAARAGVILFSLLALVGCGALAGSSAGPATPIAASDRRSPEEILRAFLAAWAPSLAEAEAASDEQALPADEAPVADYETMYALITPASQALYPLPDFQARYQAVAEELDLRGIRFSLGETQFQGDAARITYDLTLQTAGFGEITDGARQAHFQQIPGSGWRLAWSSQDIIAGLAGNTSVQLRSSRGARANIYDAQGQPLVEERGQVTILYVARDDMRDEGSCAAAIARATRRSIAAIQRLFIGKAPETYFYVGEIDPADLSAELQSECGAAGNGYTHNRAKRAYHGHGAATHVTGYIGPVTSRELAYWEQRGLGASAIVGRDGLEYYYDEILGGSPLRQLRIVEPGGTVLRELDSIAGQPAAPLTLTIDRDLQLSAARAIADAYNAAANHWGSVAFGAAAVAIDVRTGAIRALVSWPSFDPGIFNTSEFSGPIEFVAGLANSPRQPLKNRAVSQLAPGSVYKIITTAAIAEEALFAADEIFPCGHSWDGSGHGDAVGLRYDWTYADGLPPTGPVNLHQALSASCDPFYYEYGARLYHRQPALLVEYAERFGLGARSEYDRLLSAREEAGNNAPPASVSAAINNAIGQGDVQLTPLQIARAVAVIANGGQLVQPYLVERIGGVDGAPLTFEYEVPPPAPLGLREETLAAIQRGMCDVVFDGEYGTAAWVFTTVRAYSLCGKTGTAQSQGNPHAWFVAYTPKEEPRLALAVMVENSHEGALVAAPILRRILDEYYGAPLADWPPRWQENYEAPTLGPGGTGA